VQSSFVLRLCSSTASPKSFMKLAFLRVRERVCSTYDPCHVTNIGLCKILWVLKKSYECVLRLEIRSMARTGNAFLSCYIELTKCDSSKHAEILSCCTTSPFICTGQSPRQSGRIIQPSNNVNDGSVLLSLLPSRPDTGYHTLSIPLLPFPCLLSSVTEYYI
jgi:hypothetical protein